MLLGGTCETFLHRFRQFKRNIFIGRKRTLTKDKTVSQLKTRND